MNFSAALQSFAAELTSLFKLTVKANPEDQLKSPLLKLIATVSTTLPTGASKRW